MGGTTTGATARQGLPGHRWCGLALGLVAGLASAPVVRAAPAPPEPPAAGGGNAAEQHPPPSAGAAEEAGANGADGPYGGAAAEAEDAHPPRPPGAPSPSSASAAGATKARPAHESAGSAGGDDAAGSFVEAKSVAESLRDADVEVVVLPVELTAERGVRSQGFGRRLREVEALLADTAQDLGLSLALDSPEAPEQPQDETRLAELARTTGKLVIRATLHVSARTREDGTAELRIVAARPDTKALLTRVERVRRDDLVVRTVVMLRDLVTEIGRQRVVRVQVLQRQQSAEPEQSVGRAILAVSGTAYGGYIGFALQRASGSEDPRLLYPLVGVGAAVGLGAAILVAEEWDVGVGDAWYLSSGAFWPAVGSHLIYEGRFGSGSTIPEGEQWGFSLAASAAGLGLATVGLVARGMKEGGAALALSGGGTGMLLGSMAEMMVSGSNEDVPLTGMGFGAIGGWLIGATTAIHVEPSMMDVLAVDLGVLLGTVGGAAAASPLLLDDPSKGAVRGWVGAAAGGMVVGAGLAIWLSSSGGPEEDETPLDGAPGEVVARWHLPVPALLSPPSAVRGVEGGPGEPQSLHENRRGSAMGVSWSGVLW